MKFLCVPCDSPMKLQSVGPPDRGSLSVVYSCPECGYEMAMLTNAYETQVVQSLGVKIGPSTPLGSSASLGTGPSDGVTGTSNTSGGRCPFSAMIPGTDALGTGPSTSFGTGPSTSLGTGSTAPGASQPAAVRWTAAAEARLEKVPAFVRPMARTGIEQFAREKGSLEVDERILDAAKEFFGM